MAELAAPEHRVHRHHVVLGVSVLEGQRGLAEELERLRIPLLQLLRHLEAVDEEGGAALGVALEAVEGLDPWGVDPVAAVGMRRKGHCRVRAVDILIIFGRQYYRLPEAAIEGVANWPYALAHALRNILVARRPAHDSDAVLVCDVKEPEQSAVILHHLRVGHRHLSEQLPPDFTSPCVQCFALSCSCCRVLLVAVGPKPCCVEGGGINVLDDVRPLDAQL
mmetsp:Transcript_1430/g.3166  ORF Transcript_1430/g.3166 Transcript_1430/m.3166 type:complete len:221 (-) Transcript_1430:496-1158(-)